MTPAELSFAFAEHREEYGRIVQGRNGGIES
jgi:hypothetical protein